MSEVTKYDYDDETGRLRNVPVYRPESADFFVDPQKVPPWTVLVDGRKVVTGAIKIGSHYDLLSISQVASLLETGVLDVTDGLDPDVKLESLFIEATYPDGRKSVQRYDALGRYPGAAAPYSAHGKYRELLLDFHTDQLVSENGNSRLDLHLAGSVNLQLGTCDIVGSGVSATPDEGIHYEILGYVLESYRVNSNRVPAWQQLKHHLDDVATTAPTYLAELIPGLSAEQIVRAAQQHAAKVWFDKGRYANYRRGNNTPVAAAAPPDLETWLKKAGFDFSFSGQPDVSSEPPAGYEHVKEGEADQIEKLENDGNVGLALELNGNTRRPPAITYNGLAFDPFDYIGLVGQGLQDDYRAYLEVLEKSIESFTPQGILNTDTEDAYTSFRAWLLGYYAIQWMRNNGVPISLLDGVITFGEKSAVSQAGVKYEIGVGGTSDDRKQLEAYLASKPWEGREHEIDYFHKGKVIDSHRVEGQATDLTLTVGDDVGPGNANHRYEIEGFNTETNDSERPGSAQLVTSLVFQNGTIPEKGHNGITLEVLFAAAIHRLEGFQNGPFASADNEEALLHTQAALEALQRRTRNRIARQVEGTHQV